MEHCQVCGMTADTLLGCSEEKCPVTVYYERDNAAGQGANPNLEAISGVSQEKPRAPASAAPSSVESSKVNRDGCGEKPQRIDLLYEWLAPKLSTEERKALDAIYSAVSATGESYGTLEITVNAQGRETYSDIPGYDSLPVGRYELRRVEKINQLEER